MSGTNAWNVYRIGTQLRLRCRPELGAAMH
ncbi:hypothetical protein [Mycobacterium sp. C31M]